MDIYEEIHLIMMEDVCFRIQKLYEWLDISDEDREKYYSFNLEELQQLHSRLQKHKEYREKEIEERRIKKTQ